MEVVAEYGMSGPVAWIALAVVVVGVGVAAWKLLWPRRSRFGEAWDHARREGEEAAQKARDRMDGAD